MAQVDLYGNPTDNRPTTLPTTNQPVRYGSEFEDQAKALYGGHYDADAAQQFASRAGQGQSQEDILKHTAEDYAARFPGGGASSQSRSSVPGQYDDPYSHQLESIAQAQMGEVRSNPGLDSLMSFLNSQFSQLSQNPGVSTEEQALLHTQALEPIETRRAASNQRAVQRAGVRGFLPTSGLTYLSEAPQGGVESLDTSYDRQRTTADRDLALAGVNQRRADLGQALSLGQLLGLDIPRSQRSEELSLAKVPYQMGRDSLSDLLAVLGASPSSSDVFNQANQSAQQSYQQQLRSDEQNAALMEQIGTTLERIMRGGR